MSEERQLDLFSAAGSLTEPARPAADRHPLVIPETLTDDALMSAIRDAGLCDCHRLADEAGRRRLTAAVPALATLCRRFRGFGLRYAVPEQTAALQGLAAVGGAAARSAVVQIIADGVVQGPGLRIATGVAADLGCRFPPALAAVLLQSRDPDVRADAAHCAPSHPDVVALLIDLLGDLNRSVAYAAACALARLGRPESREVLLRLLREAPSREIIQAVVTIADETCIVLLGRIARTIPDLAEDAFVALTEIDDNRAAAVVAALGLTRGTAAAVSIAATTPLSSGQQPLRVGG